MSRDSIYTARNISYAFRVVLDWALHPSSTYSLAFSYPLCWSPQVMSLPSNVAWQLRWGAISPLDSFPSLCNLILCNKSTELQIKNCPICLLTVLFFCCFLSQTTTFRSMQYVFPLPSWMHFCFVWPIIVMLLQAAQYRKLRHTWSIAKIRLQQHSRYSPSRAVRSKTMVPKKYAQNNA